VKSWRFGSIITRILSINSHVNISTGSLLKLCLLFFKVIVAKKDEYVMKKVASFILFVVFHIGKGKREGISKAVFFLIKTKYTLKSLLFSLKGKPLQTFYLCLATNCVLVKISF